MAADRNVVKNDLNLLLQSIQVVLLTRLMESVLIFAGWARSAWRPTEM